MLVCMRCGLQVAYDLELARYYMWAQTDRFVYIAISVPTGEPAPAAAEAQAVSAAPGCKFGALMIVVGAMAALHQGI